MCIHISHRTLCKYMLLMHMYVYTTCTRLMVVYFSTCADSHACMKVSDKGAVGTLESNPSCFSSYKVCVFVCACVCVITCIHTNVYGFEGICTRICIYICMRIYIFIHMYVYMHMKNRFIHIYRYVYVRLYLQMQTLYTFTFVNT